QHVRSRVDLAHGPGEQGAAVDAIDFGRIVPPLDGLEAGERARQSVRDPSILAELLCPILFAPDGPVRRSQKDRLRSRRGANDGPYADRPVQPGSQVVRVWLVAERGARALNHGTMALQSGGDARVAPQAPSRDRIYGSPDG